MNSENPYRAPEANLMDEPEDAGIVLARRGQRLGAAIIDALINAMLVVPIMFAFGFFEYQKRGQTPPFLIMLGWGACGFVIFVLIHGYFLKKNGQTIGKKLVGIRITDLDDNLISLPSVLFRRYLPVSLMTVVPVAGNFLPMLDALFVFRSDRRCIHDLIAGTKVVQVKKVQSW